jgi:hypothetical protein
MLNLAYRILKRVRVHGRGKWVCTPKDFLDLGSRAAVDQALSRLVKSGLLRRISRGMYDFPRMSQVLNRPAPPNVDAAVNALARRNNARIMPDGIVAANQLGLTNAVPAKTSYVTSGATRTLKIGGRTVYLRHARQRLMIWDGRPGASVVQALYWLGSNVTSNPEIIDILKKRLSDDVKADLMKGIKLLPSWIISIVRKISPKGGATA